mmetsp:Transcript_13643/g.27934  ORF Transcript_13643/g.27934 Transcript_13643/m.27934 type:complete len:116 (-) Transcript_13643:86-433(-)|eukprot:CAMPEP_0197545138 /NCGR_PEP_ID=MMETSP1320-20131121/301_1 /TAXON_ID=91990 /ORGANISM="Bolidomonas sp., Strain RCC2347" /LENGTH=115 /DNA_ID=CAMNT_0043104619 /DNA_START=62 /DNA_END=409 /DNA_ORIENTATION=-
MNALTNFANALLRPLAARYRANVGASLSQYGLRYEDCLIEHPKVLEAIDLSDKEVLVGRNRRVKRAMDLSFKKKELGDYRPDLVEANDPFKDEIRTLVKKIEDREEEREMINKGW